MKVYGIDFSSAPSKKKPIAVAECWLLVLFRSHARIMNFFILFPFDRVFGPIRGVLVPKGPWVGGFDLPFSMPRDLIEYFNGLLVGIFSQNFIAP